MRILLVDAQRTDHEWLRTKMLSEGMIVESAFDSIDATDYLMSLQFDAVVIADPLPDAKMPGFIRDLRRDKIAAPIIVTGSDSVIDAVLCLDAGADDYIRLPYHGDEVIARIRSLVRRACGRPSSMITTGPLTIDLTTKTAAVHGVSLRLTGKEYQLLELMSLRKGVTLTKEQVLNHMYGGLDEPELKIIDVFACKLRKKMRDAGAGGLIETVWGRGYVFREQTLQMVSSPSMAPEIADMSTFGPTSFRMGEARPDELRFVESPSMAPV
jgi:two-component system cell cycle response regulator CtrA